MFFALKRSKYSRHFWRFTLKFGTRAYVFFEPLPSR